MYGYPCNECINKIEIRSQESGIILLKINQPYRLLKSSLSTLTFNEFMNEQIDPQKIYKKKDTINHDCKMKYFLGFIFELCRFYAINLGETVKFSVSVISSMWLSYQMCHRIIGFYSFSIIIKTIYALFLKIVFFETISLITHNKPALVGRKTFKVFALRDLAS